MITTNEVLKQDARGRVRVPVERRRALLEEFEKSGSSAAQFARLTGIKYHTFVTWVQKQRKERAAAPGARVCRPADQNALAASGASVRLLEALVEGDICNGGGSSRGLVVEMPGGSRMEVASPVQAQMAAELVVLIAQRARGTRC